MGKSSGSAPAAPDPVATSQAQADAYIKSAKESSKLNNLAQYTPYGNITFDKNEEGVPIAQRVSLSPEQQAAFDAQTQLQGTLSNAAAQLASSVPTGPFGLPTNLPGYTTGLDLNGAPDYMYGLNLSNVPNAPGSGDFSADRDSYQNAMFERGMSLMRPEFESQQRATQQMLANRGLPITGEAYNGEMDRLNRSQNEQMARLAADAMSAGAQEQSRMYGLGTDARSRAIAEQLQQGQVQQQARQGIISEELQNAQLAQQARQAMTNEALLQYNAPAQGVATLLGASPKTPTVQGGNIYTQGVQAPDVQGNIWNSYNAQLQAYNQRQQQNNSMWSGIGSIVGSLGSALLSDKNKKQNVKPANSILKGVEKIPVKSWEYKPGVVPGDSGQRHVGPMAQDFKGFFGLGDGKSIPVVDAVGVNMAATQQLAKKVRKLENRRNA
ncbi:MAG: tail fiber domain-containing protein [Desulfurellales bacterium]|nr:MAG: tail fiber domain-containing protein [Desulfurellales bacterium]